MKCPTVHDSFTPLHTTTVPSRNVFEDEDETQENYWMTEPAWYGKPECQASQIFAKHVAASDAEVCDVPELSLGCQDLEDLLLVSVAQLIHSTARVQAPNIVRESVDTSFRACI